MVSKDEEDILSHNYENGVYAGIVIAMMCVPVIEHYMGWEPVFYIFGSLGFVWAALFAVYGGSSPQDLCYDVDTKTKALKLTGLMDPREVEYIEATRAKGRRKQRLKVYSAFFFYVWHVFRVLCTEYDSRYLRILQ